ncbi:MAG: hypothetical protein MJ016_02765 [Victivallaceae bacterium]|nr:hypothetical protein [Victivallaceae bacterium]
MKKFFLALLLAFCRTVSGLDYADAANWIVFEKARETETSFDVFYIYPTLFKSEKHRAQRAGARQSVLVKAGSVIFIS